LAELRDEAAKAAKPILEFINDEKAKVGKGTTITSILTSAQAMINDRTIFSDELRNKINAIVSKDPPPINLDPTAANTPDLVIDPETGFPPGVRMTTPPVSR